MNNACRSSTDAGDADIDKDVADVYLPFEIQLTPPQRAKLHQSIDYYELVLKKRTRR